MATLSFYYGCMNSSKSLNALAIYNSYIENHKKIALLKPKIENRDGANVIRSRVGIEAQCEFVEDFLKRTLSDREYDLIIVDESQFLTTEQVNDLAKIVDSLNIPVKCYGLRTDFQGKLFEGAAALFALANEIKEINTICWCGKQAIFNARVSSGHIVHKGDLIQMGGNDTYHPLCRLHYNQDKPSPV